MANFKYVTFLLICITLTACSDSTKERSAAKFLLSWADAWELSDVDKMMSFYDSAESTVAIESSGKVRKGPTEIRQMYKEVFDRVNVKNVELIPIAFEQKKSFAWASYDFKATIQQKSGQNTYEMNVRGSFVMQNENNEWKITLEHFSVR